MWLASRIEPESPTFTVSVATRLVGPLDVASLQAAMSAITVRHPILRTRFVDRADTLFAEMIPDADVPLEITDLSGLPAAAARHEAREIVEVSAAHPFEMSRLPLMRAHVIRIAPEEHVVHLDVHHAVCDGWSVRLLITELEESYALLSGAADVFPGAGAPVAGYWDHLRSLPAQDAKRDLAFWRKQLKGVRLPELPGHLFQPGQGAQGAQVLFSLEASLLADVDALAERLCATRFVVLLSAFQVVLAGLGGTSDVPVGTTLSQRDTSAAEGVIGPLFNTVVLRANLRAGPRFDELVAQNTERLLDALDHGGTPFETVVRHLRGHTSSNAANPLFNVLFEMDYEAPQAICLAGTRVEPWSFAFTTPKSDFDVSLAPVDGRLAGSLTYRPSACDAATATSVEERLRVVLELVTDEARDGHRLRTRRIPVLTAAERVRLDSLCDGGPAELPEACLHSLFEEQARRTPDNVAVRETGADGAVEAVTYKELDRRADRIARALAARGVGPETRVAVFLHRSADLVAALIGVAKAGGAYVPLDPAFPPPRLRHVVQDSQAAVVLTEPALIDAAVELGSSVMLVDEEAPPGTGLRSTGVSPGHLCYVVYTSGSTGRPKGVLVEHRGLVNFLLWCVRRYIADRTGGAPVFSSIAFDMIVPNLFAPLLAGQTVTVVSETVTPAELGSVLCAAGPFAFIKLTPGHLELLNGQLTAGQARALAGLLVVGADAFPRAALHAWRRLDPDTPVLNEYGPTEASVANSAHEAVEGDEHGVGDLPIGLPIPRTTLHILDAAANRVPPGVTGEIYIGGDCVARGYAQQPGLTASRFVPDPYGATGSRMYRTGDLARWNADGQAEFLGRADQQVKIRGYRVEPAEVESAVAQHPDVGRAVVIPVRTPSGHLALAAYAVPHSAARHPSTGELRAYLNTRLPHYLVPTAITWLDALPLDENGKTDRKALPPPQWQGSGSPKAADRVGSETQTQITALWAELLGIPADGIGAEDDFFSLGGNSLLLLALLERLRRRYNRRVSFGEVLRQPTVSALAGMIEAESTRATAGGRTSGSRDDSPRSLEKIQGAEEGELALVLVHPVGGTVFCYRDLVAHLPVEQPVYGLTLAAMTGRDDLEEGEDGIGPMSARYAREIADTIGKRVIFAAWSAGAPVALETARHLETLGRGTSTVVLLDPCALDDAAGWRRQEHELSRMRARLGSPGKRGREAELDAISRSRLVASMGVDPATCRVAARLFEDALAVWQRQCARLAAHRPATHRGDLLLVTSPDDVHAERWARLATGTVGRVMVGGGHFAMLGPPYAVHIAEALAMFLPTAPAGRPSA